MGSVKHLHEGKGDNSMELIRSRERSIVGLNLPFWKENFTFKHHAESENIYITKVKKFFHLKILFFS